MQVARCDVSCVVIDKAIGHQAIPSASLTLSHSPRFTSRLDALYILAMSHPATSIADEPSSSTLILHDSRLHPLSTPFGVDNKLTSN